MIWRGCLRDGPRADHVTDMHEVIVDDAGEIVGHHPVRTEDDEISIPSGAKLIFPWTRSSKTTGPPSTRNLKTGRCRRIPALRRPPAKENGTSVVPGHLSLESCCFLSASSLSGEQKHYRPCSAATVGPHDLVERQALGLAIGTVRPSGQGPHPTGFPTTGGLEDMIDGFIRRPVKVRVLNPKDECSPVMFGEEKVEQGGFGISDMEKPVGEGAKRTRADDIMKILQLSGATVRRSNRS